MHASRTLALTVLIFGLTACATPQIALDQANNGVRLTQNLQAELANYQRNAKIAAERRLRSVEVLETGSGQVARDNEYQAYLYDKAGKDDELAARERIRGASDTYTKLLLDEEKGRRELATRLAGIVQPLPSSAEKLAAVQKALAELGTELSAAERLAIVTKFLGEAKAIADKNVPQAEPAAAAASAAP